MKISELSGESFAQLIRQIILDDNPYTGYSAKEGYADKIAEKICDLTVELDVEAMAKIISEIAFHKYKPNGEAYLESRPKEVAQYLAQSVKQFIKIVKE